MREHLPKIVILLLVLLVVGGPLVLRGGDDVSLGADAAPGDKLIIYTPHNEQIRYEFAEGFNRNRLSRGQPPVRFDWRSSGGTSDLRKQVLSQYEALAERHGVEAIDARGIGGDIFFGGGEYEHNQLASGVEVGNEAIPVVRPIRLPEGLLDEAFPSPLIGGEKLYHPDLLWVGTTLSSFGIVYNRDVLAMKNLPEPRTWADLTDPRYFGDLALSDPTHSGSIAVTYETIVKRLGWHAGWALLRRCFANARYFSSSSSKVPVDVSAGEAAAGMCIDFYGRFQAGAIANADGSSRVGYIDPAGLTATTADPISILRGAPHPELADAFVAWTLSPQAQRLWQYRLGSEEGPKRFELRRQPIRVDAFSPRQRQHFTDPEIDPFGQARPMPPGTPGYYRYIAPITHAMGIDNHDRLKAAWQAIQRAGPDHPRHAEMLALFDAMPPELTITWPDAELARDWRDILQSTDHPRRDEVVEVLRGFTGALKKRWSDDDQQLRDRLAWARFFADNYDRILRLAQP